MKKSFYILLFSVLINRVSFAQIPNASTEIKIVYGNCGMCKSAIENAANKRKISKVEWNEDTKLASIIYNSKKTNVDAILKRIALAGFDNQSFLAPDEAYNNLPACCKYNRLEKHTALIADEKNNEKINPQNNLPSSTQETKQLKIVFDNYFNLKDALVKTDATSAAAIAHKLEDAIKSVKMDELSMDVHMVWMKVFKDLKSGAEKIAGANDIAAQRNIFMNLSKNMYDLAKVDKPAKTVYYQFCPMANNGKGANWLSQDKDIKNPYYGNRMLTCGSTLEIIKP